MIANQTEESARQIQRYIRLTNLIPELLTMVDQGKIALTPAVELSYLRPEEQQNLMTTMESEDCTPSLSQAQQMKFLSRLGKLDMDMIFRILSQPKANQKEKISFQVDEIRSFFPKGYTAVQMSREIMAALEERQRHWKGRDRDGR